MDRKTDLGPLLVSEHDESYLRSRYTHVFLLPGHNRVIELFHRSHYTSFASGWTNLGIREENHLRLLKNTGHRCSCPVILPDPYLPDSESTDISSLPLYGLSLLYSNKSPPAPMISPHQTPLVPHRSEVKASSFQVPPLANGHDPNVISSLRVNQDRRQLRMKNHDIFTSLVTTSRSETHDLVPLAPRATTQA